MYTYPKFVPNFLLLLLLLLILLIMNAYCLTSEYNVIIECHVIMMSVLICRSADLISIRDQEENDYILAHMPDASSNRRWTGLIRTPDGSYAIQFIYKMVVVVVIIYSVVL